MNVNKFEELQEKTNNIELDDLYATICKNVKKYRLEKYQEFKNVNPYSAINPYSTENIAALLDYNHNHYKRFESDTDSTKRIPLNKLVKLSVILEKRLDDFLK